VSLIALRSIDGFEISISLFYQKGDDNSPAIYHVKISVRLALGKHIASGYFLQADMLLDRISPMGGVVWTIKS